jgi:hypothetical protein
VGKGCFAIKILHKAIKSYCKTIINSYNPSCLQKLALKAGVWVRCKVGGVPGSNKRTKSETLLALRKALANWQYNK